MLITSTADIVFEEKADHSRVPVAGRGQLWVRNDSPNVLVFTDDTGVDTVLGAGGGGGLPTGTVTNSILRWDGAAWVEETGFEVDVNGAIARFGAQNNYEMSNNISDTLRLTSGGSSNTISMDFGGGSNITRLITDGSGVRFSDGQNGDQIWTYNKNGANRFFNNDVETARTATLAAGGLEVNNTVTGAGFERVLTTSDLGGGGGTIGGTISNNQIAVGALVTDDIEGSATFTWDGTDMRIGNSFFRDDGGSQFRYTSNSATQSGINFHDGLAAFRGRINTNSGNMQFLTQTTTGLILNDAGTVDIYNNNVLVAQTNAQGLELYRAGGGQLSIGDAALDLQIEHDGTTGSITQFGGIGSLAIQNRVNSQFVNIGSDDSGGTFRVGAQIGGATPNVELNYNGNQRFETSNEGITVGRGTFVATSYELSVQNSTGTDTYIEILNNAGTNQGAFFGMETANDFALYNWQGGPIIFYTDTVASSGAVRMRIENDGDIALGNFVFNAQQSVGAGQDNFVLTYDDASGEISLEAAPGGGGSPGGATTNVQFNNSSSFDGDPEFVWDTVGKVLTLIDGGANGQIDLYQTATAGTVEADLDLDLLSDGTIRVHTGGEGFTISTRIDSDLPHRISAASEVQIDFADTAATAGNQNFRIINDSEQFAIQLFNDAFTVGANALAITRTANTIDQIRMFPGDMIDIPNGAGLYLADRADHFNTPAAGRGELWMRTSDDALVFTDPSGTDHDLTAAGGGNVSNSGTPVNDQLAIWVDATTIEGITNLTWNGGSNRLSLVSAGIEIDAAQRIYLDGGSNTWIQEQSADVIGFNAGGFTRMTVGSSINMDVTTITQADTSSPADNLFIMQTGANRNNRIRWTEAGVTRGQIGYVNSTDAIVVQGPVQSVQTWADEGSAILRGFSTQDVNASGTSIDLDLGNYFYKTITGATTFTFDNAKANLATHFYLELTNPSTNITWPASVDWAGGSAPTLTTTGVDILEFITRDGGTTWHGRVYSLDSQ